MRRLAPIAVASAILVGTACGAGGVRPPFKPLDNAVVDTVNAAPADVIQQIATLATQEVLQVQWSSPKDGYYESQWFNVTTQQTGAGQDQNLDRVVKFRFWADPISDGTKTKLTCEAVIRTTNDPSVMERDKEAMVPPGHAGMRILDRILAGLKQRFGS